MAILSKIVCTVSDGMVCSKIEAFVMNIDDVEKSGQERASDRERERVRERSQMDATLKYI